MYHNNYYRFWKMHSLRSLLLFKSSNCATKRWCSPHIIISNHSSLKKKVSRFLSSFLISINLIHWNWNDKQDKRGSWHVALYFIESEKQIRVEHYKSQQSKGLFQKKTDKFCLYKFMIWFSVAQWQQSWIWIFLETSFYHGLIVWADQRSGRQNFDCQY